MKTFLRRIIASLFERQVRRVIVRHKVRVIAVGGSVGKTSTKAAIAAVLNEKFRTLGQSGGYNSDIGIPLAVFELSVPGSVWNPFAWGWRLLQSELQIARYPYEILVLELGTDHPGEIARYLRYLTPDIGVITAITPEHMENFPGGLDEVAAEELQLAGKSKRLLANVDEIPAKYRHHYIDTHSDHQYYGLGSGPDFGFVMAHTDPLQGTTGAITHSGHVALKAVKLQLFGAHSAKAALAAYAVGDMLGISKQQIESRLTQLTPTAGRMNPLPGINGSVIIDDSYNAQPHAVMAALAALADAPVKGRRIAILGSMNELGPDAAKYHEQVGTAAASVDLLVTIGQNANEFIGPSAVRAGLDPTRFKPADSPYAAGEFVKLLLTPGDVVLVKGSQNGVFSEEAAKLLLADPVDAQRLVRQSLSWLRTKARQFPHKL